MVKIRELSDKQLVSQLEKYEKIYNQLITEREKRAGSKGGHDGLLTEKEMSELAPEEEELVAGKSQTQAFQLKFDQEELNQMQQDEEKATEVEEDDEVRVTQLLRLSKEQMEELKQGAKKITKKKVMKKKKI